MQQVKRKREGSSKVDDGRNTKVTKDFEIALAAMPRQADFKLLQEQLLEKIGRIQGKIRK